ncbi:MAG: signal recognition particle-docking protein FtsY, partial [Synechococcus sp.]
VEPDPEPVAEVPEPAPQPEPEPQSEPEPAAPSPPSWLEAAAARRQERFEQLVEEQPSAEPEPELVQVSEPEAEPKLGQLDEDFLWSAEVLAAQGRQVDQVSLEEIDWLGRLRRGMEKTRQNFVTTLLDNLGDDPLSEASLDDIETLLLQADVGVEATDQVLDLLRRRMNETVVDGSEAINLLKEQLRNLLDAPIKSMGANPLLAPQKGRLNIWLMVGVNGVGKTTTLGKLANLAVRSGYSCLVAAGDTFRAAAVQQLQVWADRSGVPLVANPSANADPAAVVFDAIGAAQAKDIELLLVDTAGRLQTKNNLMEVLSKVRRIVDRLAPDAAVESLLVLDASQGQNGLRQAMAFAKAAGLTGVVLTKLDGTARGGVAFAVASESNLPIRFIGAGEGLRDLRPFNSFEFVEALLARA